MTNKKAPIPYYSYLVVTSKEGIQPFSINFSNAKVNDTQVKESEVLATVAQEYADAADNSSVMNHFRLFIFNKIYGLTFNNPTYFSNYCTNIRACPPGYVTFEARPIEPSDDEPLPFTLKDSSSYYNLDQMEEVKALTFHYFYFVSKTAVDAIFPLDQNKVYAQDFFQSAFLYHRDTHNSYYFLFKSEEVRQHFLDTLDSIHPALRNEVPTLVSDSMTGVFNYGLNTSYQELHLRREGLPVVHKFNVLTSTNAGNAKYFAELAPFCKEFSPENIINLGRKSELYVTEVNHEYPSQLKTQLEAEFESRNLKLPNFAQENERLEITCTGCYSTELNQDARDSIVEFFTNSGVFTNVIDQEENKRVFVGVAGLLEDADFVACLCDYLRYYSREQQEQTVLLSALKDAVVDKELSALLDSNNPEVSNELPVKYAFYFKDPGLKTISKLKELFAEHKGFALTGEGNKFFLTYEDPKLEKDLPSTYVAFNVLERLDKQAVLEEMAEEQILSMKLRAEELAS